MTDNVTGELKQTDSLPEINLDQLPVSDHNIVAETHTADGDPIDSPTQVDFEQIPVSGKSPVMDSHPDAESQNSDTGKETKQKKSEFPVKIFYPEQNAATNFAPLVDGTPQPITFDRNTVNDRPFTPGQTVFKYGPTPEDIQERYFTTAYPHEVEGLDDHDPNAIYLKQIVDTQDAKALIRNNLDYHPLGEFMSDDSRERTQSTMDADIQAAITKARKESPLLKRYTDDPQTFKTKAPVESQSSEKVNDPSPEDVLPPIDSIEHYESLKAQAENEMTAALNPLPTSEKAEPKIETGFVPFVIRDVEVPLAGQKPTADNSLDSTSDAKPSVTETKQFVETLQNPTTLDSRITTKQPLNPGDVLQIKDSQGNIRYYQAYGEQTDTGQSPIKAQKEKAVLENPKLMAEVNRLNGTSNRPFLLKEISADEAKKLQGEGIFPIYLPELNNQISKPIKQNEKSLSESQLRLQGARDVVDQTNPNPFSKNDLSATKPQSLWNKMKSIFK